MRTFKDFRSPPVGATRLQELLGNCKKKRSGSNESLYLRMFTVFAISFFFAVIKNQFAVLGLVRRASPTIIAYLLLRATLIMGRFISISEVIFHDLFYYLREKKK